MGDLQLATVHLHDAVMRSGLLMTPLAHPLLPGREREVLQWMAAGKSRQDLGDTLGISARTIKVHLRSAREKLGVLTMVQAVGRAIGRRIILPRAIGPKAA
jgi:DNA-binding CsgD family transcriptional regulator